MKLKTHFPARISFSELSIHRRGLRATHGFAVWSAMGWENETSAYLGAKSFLPIVSHRSESHLHI